MPPGSDPLPEQSKLRFLGHLARMHATFWGFEDHYPLLGPRERYQALTSTWRAG